MSFVDKHGVQVHPDELQDSSVSVEDAWAIVHLIDQADALTPEERRRLCLAVLDAHVFAPALGGQVGVVE